MTWRRLIDDSSNATPASVASSLALLEIAEPAPGGRRVAVLGEIGHLGPKEIEIHADLAALIDRHRVDRLFYRVGFGGRRTARSLPAGRPPARTVARRTLDTKLV